MSSHFPISVLLAAHTASLGQYWHKLTDKTFTGIYHANFFDLAMMIPYFIVLFVLALYGMHRYWLVYDYYKYSRNVPGPTPEVKGAWPRVTVQLPIFNERYVIERLVEAVSRFHRSLSRRYSSPAGRRECHSARPCPGAVAGSGYWAN